MNLVLRLALLLAILAAAGLAGAGCKSPESENRSERPWNSPRGWENGLPSSINEGR